MGLSWLLIAGIGLASPSVDGAPSSPARATHEPDVVPHIVVAADGLEPSTLEHELRLRFPERTIWVEGSPEDGDVHHVSLEVLPDDHVVVITVTTPEAQVYQRELPLPAARVERETALVTASLLLAIEAGDAVPLGRPPTPTEPPPPALPAPAAADAPVPPSPKRIGAPTPRVRWAIGAGAGAMLGVAPRVPPGPYLATAGEVDVEVYGRSGAAVRGGLRFGGHRRDHTSTLRARLTLGGGWRWDRGRAATVVAACVAVEPWWLTHEGRALRPAFRGERTRAPLLGFVTTVDAGFEVGDTDRAPHVRVGPHLEVGGTALPLDGLRYGVVDVRDGDGQRRSIARMGGLELMLGLRMSWGR